jgi:hypothetical protein
MFISIDLRRILMNLLLKGSRLFVLAMVPVLAVGMFFALQTDMDKDSQATPFHPGIVTPEDQGLAPLPIVPDDREKTKVEYRNILFNRGNEAETFHI